MNEIFKGQQIRIHGSGRTDAGVHAIGQVVHFTLNTTIKPQNIMHAVNTHLRDKSIYIKACKIVDKNFHARFSAKKREYYYKVSNSFSVFTKNHVWYVKTKINFDILNECAKFIKGKHDFSNFCKINPNNKNNVCIVYESYWVKKKNIYIYYIVANRFLHHMVRFLTGSMIEVSRDRYSTNNFYSALNDINSPLKILSAPPQGLYLKKVFYE